MATRDLVLLLKARDEASRALAQVDKSLGNIDASAGRTSNAFGGAMKVVAGAAGAAALALGAAVVGAVKLAMDFEQSMSGIKAVSGATAQEMKQLTALTLQLGADTAYSAGEAAQGIEEMIKGGISIPDIMAGAAKSMLDLAAAGGVSLPEAAEIAANSMAMFSLGGNEMAHVADLIAGAANASSLSVSDFKFSLAAAGAIAALSGQTFDDLAVAIAVMGKSGIKGSDAGTSLKTMLMSLQPTTKKATEAMQQLGILTAEGSNQFIDAAGNIKSMAEIAGVLQTALKGLTEAEKLAALEVMFGSDAIRASAILAKAGAEGFDEMAAAMGKVTAASVAAERLNNLKGSMEQLKGSVETAGIALGMAFIPLLRPVIDGATQVVNGMMPMIQTFGERLPGAIATVGSVIGDVVATIRRFGVVLGGLATADPFDLLVTGLGRLGVKGVDAGRVVWIIKDALASLRTIAAPVAQTMRDVASAFTTLFQTGDLSDAFVNILTAFGVKGVDAGRILWDLKDAFASLPSILALVGRAFAPVVAAIGGVVEAWRGLLTTGDIGAFVRNLAGADAQLITALAGLGQTILTWIGAQLPAIWAQMQTWGAALWGWVQPMAASVLTELGNLAGQVWTWVQAQVPVLVGQLAAWGQSLVDWIGPKIPLVLAELGKIPGLIGAALGSVNWAGIWRVITDALGSVGTWIGEKIAGLDLGSLPGKIGALLGSIDFAGAWKTITDKLGDLAEWAGDRIAALDLGSIPGKLLTLVQSIDWEAIWQTITDALADLGIWVSGIIEALDLGAVVTAISERLASVTIPPIRLGSITLIPSAINLGDVGAGLGGLLGTLGDIGDAIASRVGPTIRHLIDSFAEAGAKLAPVWDQLKLLFENLAPILAVVAAAILGIANILVNVLAGALPGIAQVFAGLAEVVLGLINVVLTPLAGLIRVIAALFSGDFAGALQIAIDTAWKMSAAIQSVFTGLKDVVLGIVSALVGAVVGFFEGLYYTLIGGSIIPDMVNAITGAFEGLSDSATAIFNGIVAFLVGIWTSISGTATTVWNTLSAFLGEAMANILDALGIDWGPITRGWQTFTDAVRPVAGIITGVIRAFLDLASGASSLADLRVELLSLLGIDFGPLIDAIGAVVDAWRGLLTTGDLGAFIRNLAGADAQLAAALAGLGQTILTWIGSQLPAIWAQLQTWGAAFIGWVSPLIPPILAALGGLVSQLWGWVQAQAPVWLAQLGAWASAFIGWVSPLIPPLLAQLGTLAGQLIAWLGEQAAPILAKLGEWALAFVKWIAPMIPPFLLALTGVVAALVVFLVETAATIGLKLLQWAAAFIGWVQPMIPLLTIELAKLLLSIIEWGSLTALPAIKRQLYEWSIAFVNWVAPQIPLLIAELGKLLTSLTTWLSATALPGIVKGFGDIWDGVKSAATSAWGDITTFIKGQINSIIDLINRMIGAWNNLEARIPGFNVTLPSVEVPGIGTIGGGNLSWPGIGIASPDIGMIPKLAAGTDWFRGGMAMVGERGPELVNLPRGSSVLSAGASRDSSIDYAALGEAVAAAIERRARADVTGIMTAMWQGDVLAALRAVVLNTEGQSSDYGLARSLAGA